MSRCTRLLLALAPGLALSNVAFALTVDVGAVDGTCLPITDTTCATRTVVEAIEWINLTVDPGPHFIEIGPTYVAPFDTRDGVDDAELDLPLIEVPVTIRSGAADPTTNAWKLRAVRAEGVELILENLVIKAGDVITDYGSGEYVLEFSAVDVENGDVNGTNLILEPGHPSGAALQYSPYFPDVRPYERHGLHGVVVIEGDLTLTDVTASDFPRGSAVSFRDDWDPMVAHDFVISDSAFTENTGWGHAEYQVGGVQALGAGSGVIERTAFRDNDKHALVFRGVSLTVEEADFTGNGGAGIWFLDTTGTAQADLTVLRSEFVGNFRTTYPYDRGPNGALTIQSTNKPTHHGVVARVEDSVFSSNTSTVGTGDLWWEVDGDTLQVVNTAFDHFTGSYAGSVYVKGGRARFTDVTWSAGGGGIEGSKSPGAVRLQRGDFACEDCDFVDVGSQAVGAFQADGDGAFASFVDGAFIRTTAQKGFGGAIAAGPLARVDLDGTRFEDTSALYGGAIFLLGKDDEGATLTGRGVTIENALAEFGGAIYVRGSGSAARFEHSRFEGTTAFQPLGALSESGFGGVAFVDPGNTFELFDSVVSGATADRDGGALYGVSTPLTWPASAVPGPCWYADPNQWYGGPQYFGPHYGSTWRIDGVAFEDGTAGRDGSAAMFGRFDDVTMRASTVTGNVAKGAGTVVTRNASAVDLSCNTFCDNQVATGGSAVEVSDDGLPIGYAPTVVGPGVVQAATASADGYYWGWPKDVRYTVENNVVQDGVTVGPSDGGAIHYALCAASDFDPFEETVFPRGGFLAANNTFVGNTGGDGNLAGESGDVRIDARNNLFQDGEVGWNVGPRSLYVEGGFNLYGDLATEVVDLSPDGTGFPGATDQTEPAVFRSYAPGTCASELYLEPGSPGIDQGDPTMLDSWEAVPGTPNAADIGAFGGPEACVADVDCDAWNAILDCDDGEGTTFPDAVEVAYDGIDQDCDGTDFCDVDGDGHDADFGACTGDDCNDVDAAIHPGATDILDDGIDQDCSGADAVTDDDLDDDRYSGTTWGGPDCDDSDASIHPGAEEVPYDGIDQDCDGSDLTDVDCDGFPGGPGGTDCDDSDATIFPGASDNPFDDIDQDCDGAPADLWGQGGCACAAPGATPVGGLFGFAAAAVALLRRRRGQR